VKDRTKGASVELLKIYLGDITVKETDDGCCEVYGKATGPDLDLDYQICDAVWLAKAMPAWMETGANVRAMHTAIAAGIGIELEEKAQSWWLKSLVVDANEVNKCKKKVYKGYSIGIANARVIKDAEAPNGRIIDGDIVEVSLVDRPANPTALMELCKMAKDLAGVDVLGFTTKTGEVSAPDPLLTKAAPPNGLDLTGANPVTDPGVEPPTPEEANLCPDCSAGIANDEACATCGGTGVLPRVDKAEKVNCPTCDGDGKIKGDSTDCPDCDATGKVTPEKAKELKKSLDVAATDEFGWTEAEKATWSDLQKALFPDLAKKKYTDDERTDMAAKGEAMPGGGFPIKDVDDLKNAIQAIGRAKDPAAAKKHIKARAKSLGQTALIPDSWKAISAGMEKLAPALVAMRGITKGATPDEWMHDPTCLQAVLSGLIACASQELEEMANGEDERWDVEDLLYCISLFTSWWQHEAWEGETTGPFDGPQGDEEVANIFVGLGVKPELLKVAGDESATDEQRATARTEIVKALGLDGVAELTALLKSATERSADLEDRLATVEEMAAPGGPAKRGSANQQQKSDEAENLRKEANKFMEIASTLEDQGRKRYYIGKAQSALSDAEKLERV
jgi:hypothetical protein